MRAAWTWCVGVLVSCGGESTYYCSCEGEDATAVASEDEETGSCPVTLDNKDDSAEEVALAQCCDGEDCACTCPKAE